MELVKITINDLGDKQDSPKWHLGTSIWDAPRTFCGGEAYTFGESSAVYQSKPLDKGKITCPRCRELIKAIKSIKLS